MFKKKKEEQPKGYSFKPREYDREEKITLQKIVSNIPVTRKLLSQDLLVKATYNYAARNLKEGSIAARNVNTTKHPQLFFSSLKTLFETTENLIKIEPFWKFQGHTPTEQLEDLTTRKDAVIKGFINDSFTTLLEEIEKKRSNSAKQRLFDEYQAGIMAYIDICGEDNFEYFKNLVREKMNITEE